MALSHDIISQFAKVVNSDKKQTTESTIYGTVVDQHGHKPGDVDTEGNTIVIDKEGGKYIKPDGSDQLIPITDNEDDPAKANTMANTEYGDRASVLIKNHTATVTGNISSPATNDKVVDTKISEANIIIAKQIQADKAYLQNLISDKASIGELKAAEAKITDLEADNAVINNNLKAANAEITNLKSTKIDADIVEANYATIEKLEATNADVKSLDADVADINTLMFGSATGNVLQTTFANAVIALLGDAQIKSAMIESLNASKINAGSVNTNNVKIESDDGKLVISDNTIQISDDNRVRVQIGKDASNDYSISIWDADGNLMFSEGGITDSAIKEAIIRNDMISDDANIDAKKLDISSLFTEINNGTETIKSTKVYFDSQEQTLDMAFNEMNTTLTEQGETIESQGTDISVIQGQIESKVWQQDIDTATNEQTTKYSKLEQDLNGFKTTVSETTSKIQGDVDKVSGDLATFSNNTLAELSNLQDQIDGSIMTWFYAYEPTLENEPASLWSETDLKNQHLGDLFYDLNTGYCYRWQVSNQEYSWQLVKDADVTKALEDAAKAQDTADSKRRVFSSTPTTPYEVGDLWTEGSTGELKRCRQTRLTGSFYESDWELATKYTDDSAVENLKIGGRNLLRFTGDLPITYDLTTGIGSYGTTTSRNIFNINGRVPVTNEWSGNGNKRQFTGNQVFIGMTANNYLVSPRITNYSIGETTTFTTISSGYGLGFDVAVTPNTTYTCHCNTSNGELRIGLFDNTGAYLRYTYNEDNPSTFTFTTKDSEYWAVIVLTTSKTNTEISFTDIQLELGSVATAYEPCLPSVPIKPLTETSEGVMYDVPYDGKAGISVPLIFEGAVQNGDLVTLSFDYRSSFTDAGAFYFLQRTTPNVYINTFPDLIVSEEWRHYTHTFSSDEANVRGCYAILLFYMPSGEAGRWIEIKQNSLKLEHGNKDTAWTAAQEDMVTQDQLHDVQTVFEERTATLEKTSSGIQASVTAIQTKYDGQIGELQSNYETLKSQVNLKVDSDSFNVAITEIKENGVTSVDTGMGHSFTKDGLIIKKIDHEGNAVGTTNTKIDHEGMTVYDNANADKPVVLTANKDGVDAKDLHATTYLIIGEGEGRSRFEDYKDHNNNKRTGCFWIGG